VSATSGPTPGVDINSDPLLKAFKLAQRNSVERKQRRCHCFQARLAVDQMVDPCCKALRRGWPNLKPEAAQNAAQAHLDVVQLRLHQLARRQ
jgi:hypothetical protein